MSNEQEKESSTQQTPTTMDKSSTQQPSTDQIPGRTMKLQSVQDSLEKRDFTILSKLEE